MLKKVVVLFFVVTMFSGWVLAQSAVDTPPRRFSPIRNFGETAPRGVIYDPNFDQLAMIHNGQLKLVDARTFAPREILPLAGVTGYTFSHDGTMLALSVDRRVEIYDTQNAELLTSIEPAGALAIAASPFQFSSDDSLLHFTAIVPAPDSVRRSETDTATLSWLWDVAAELKQRSSILPGGVLAEPFFEWRNFPMVLGANNKLMVAFENEILVKGIMREGLPNLSSIVTTRYERDPIDVWFSDRSQQMYFRSLDQGRMYQVDTVTGLARDLQLGATARGVLGTMAFSEQAQIIGDSYGRMSNSLLNAILGQQFTHPMTIALIDVLQPVTLSPDQAGLLMYVYNDQTTHGTLELIRPKGVQKLTLHPDGTHLMMRRFSGEVEIYELATGRMTLNLALDVADVDGSQVLAFNRTGDEIIVGWQRFDALTGELINEASHYLIPSVDRFFFSADDQTLNTFSGDMRWRWDIETGALIERERFIRHENVTAIWRDGSRFLSLMRDDITAWVEIVDWAQDERVEVRFDALPGRFIENVYHSPDWNHFLVVYSANPYTAFYPGNEVAIYNRYTGLVHFLQGDDLPPNAERVYGWVDSETAFVTGVLGMQYEPERIYGLEYHESGLPLCLVEAFPDDWTQWRNLWEYFVQAMQPNALGRMTQRLCAARPTDFAEVMAVFTPAPLPTLPPFTPTPALVAGLPACLSQMYPADAAQYAREWRALTEGLSADALAQLQMYLCDGLEGGGSPNAPIQVDPFVFESEVMLIDVATGERVVRWDMPQAPVSYTQSVDQRLRELLTLQFGVSDSFRLSNDKTMIAVRNQQGYVSVYRLEFLYDDLIQEQMATATASVSQRGRTIALAPTATPPFVELGPPRPTMTPTVTPTAPPLPDEVLAQKSESFMCAFADTLFTLDNPPPDYQADGYLIVQKRNDSRYWRYDMATGAMSLDDRFVPIAEERLSPDRQWVILQRDGGLAVARVDGRDERMLLSLHEIPENFLHISWLDARTIEYVVEGIAPSVSVDPVVLIYHYDVETQTLSEPFLEPDAPMVNGLPASAWTKQPARGPLEVVSMDFSTGFGVGRKFYIYDRDTGVASYFMRVLNESFMPQFRWSPDGDLLYYQMPLNRQWYVMETATRKHYLFDEALPYQWSPDGQYSYMPYREQFDVIAAMRERGEPIPALTVSHSQSGEVRHYCIPNVNSSRMDRTLHWSPDSRYIAFIAPTTRFSSQELQYPDTLVLDRVTGSVTYLTFEIESILVWAK